MLDGQLPIKELLSTMNTSKMTDTMFKHKESEKKCPVKRKKRLEKVDNNQGVPAITVICDGDWSNVTH